MKKVYLLAAIFLLAQITLAQSELQEYGKIDLNDLKMKECDFDKEADAMVLFEKGRLFVPDRNAYLNVHKRIKIFNERGKKYSTIKLKYFYGFNKEEEITGLKAQVYSLDKNGEEVIRKVEGKFIRYEKLKEKERAIVIEFPDVKAGDVIEYRYTLRTRLFTVPDWKFQSDLPSRYSYFSLDIQNALGITSVLTGPYSMATDKSSTYDMNVSRFDPMGWDVRGGWEWRRSISNFQELLKDSLEYRVFNRMDRPYQILFSKRELAAQNIPAFKGGSTTLSLQKLSLQLNPAKETYWWSLVASNLLQSPKFGAQLTKNLPGRKEFLKGINNLESDEKKVNAIYNYVRIKMTWDGTDSRGAIRSINKAWKEGKGSSGEINLALVNLLNKAGIPAKPLLVNTRGNTEINPSSGNLLQFNKSVAYVPLKSGIMVLDATQKDMPLNSITTDIFKDRGFIVKKGEPEWIELKPEAFDNPGGKAKGEKSYNGSIPAKTRLN